MATPRKPRVVTKPIDDDSTPDLIDLDDQTADEKSEFTNTAPLFRAGGTVYEARTTFTAGEALTYTKTIRDNGLDEAVAYALTLAVGEAGWQALVTHPTLSNEKMSEIIDQVVTRVNPPMDDPKFVKR